MDLYSLKFVANISDLERAERELDKVQGQLDKLKKPTEVKLTTPELEQKSRELKEYVENLKSAERALQSFRDVGTVVGKGLQLISAGAIAAGGGLAFMFHSINERIQTLDDIADKTGLAIEQISIMQQVAQNSGLGIDKVSQSLTFFQRAQNESANATSKQSAAFKLLGITQQQAMGDTGAAFDLVAEKIAQMDDGWQKNSVSMALFGKSGSEINEFLADYANRGGIVADITTKMRTEADVYNRSIAGIVAIGHSYVSVFGAGVMPVAARLATEFKNMATEVLGLDKNSRSLLEAKITDWAWTGAKAIAWLGDVVLKAGYAIKGVAQTVGLIGFSIAGLLDILASGPEKASSKWAAFKTTFDELAFSTANSFDKATNTVNVFGAAVERAKNIKIDIPAAPDPKNSNRGTEQVLEAARAQAEQARLQAQYNSMLERANDLLNQQEAKKAKLNGESGEQITLEHKFNKLLEDAKNLKNSSLITQLEEIKAKTLGISKDVESVELRKKRLETDIKIKEAQDQLNTSTERWAQIIKNTEYGSLLTRVKSPQQQAQDTYDKAALDIRSGGQDKADQLRRKADEASKNGNEELATGYNRTADQVLVEMNSQLDKLRSNYEQTQAASGSAWEGMKAGMENFAAGIPTVANSFADLTKTGLNGLADGITTLVTSGGSSFKKFTSDLLKQIAAMIIKMLALRAIMAAVGFAGGGTASAAPTIAGDASNVNLAANGAVYAPTGLLMSANGNVFDGPTLHGYGNGKIGLLGEAGPEAVMPLARTSSGQLGVQVVGSTGQSSGSTFQIQVNVTMPNGNAGDNNDRKSLAKEITQTIESTVYRIIGKEKRDGGLLAA